MEPQPAGLTHFHVKTPTPHGPAELEMSEPDHWRLIVPEGTAALFRGKTLESGTHELVLQKEERSGAV